VERGFASETLGNR